MAAQYGGTTTPERRKALEQRIGADRVVELFDDDGDGLVAGEDLVTLETVLAAADDIVSGILLYKGWSPDGLVQVATDRQVVRCWTGIAAQLASERKPEWLDEQGQGRFHAFGVDGRAELGKLARGENRSVAEVTAGPPAVLSGWVDEHPLEFSPDPRIPGDRGRGGF